MKNQPDTEQESSFSDDRIMQNAGVETGETYETYCASNQVFLEALFGTSAADNRPVLVSFEGNPNGAPKGAWVGRPWAQATAPLPTDANNYFSLATFSPDEAGNYRRQKKYFAALHAVMLDDIGTKIPADRITLAPSWRLETSPGNFQIGYIIDTPISESKIADQLMNAIINAGLCDPGAGGPTARMARLPLAVNGKYQLPFPCHMTEWCPDRRYTTDELVKGLQLEIHQPKHSSTRLKQQHNTQAHDGATISIPCPTENTVITTLKSRDLYKMPLGSGKHDITCPWVAEHTDGVDGGTAYFEPTDSWPIGGFKCLHGHCADRHIRDLLQYLEIEAKDAWMKPIIRVLPGEIHRVVDAAERELASTGKHYQRGGLVVTVVTDPGTKETRVQESNQPSLVQALAGVAIWEKFDGRTQEFVRIDPPARHVTVLYDKPDYSHLPLLNGLARQPYLRTDDTLMTKAGYDAESGMFGIFAEKDFSVPENPAKGDAQVALEMLRGMLAEFSFATETDSSAALAAVLTAAVRPRLSGAPMIHIKAHQVGSGKSYLCRLITIFATPQHGTPNTFPKEDEECRKLLLSELLRAPAVIEFDNLTGDLVAHKSLCTVLTSEHMRDRILGISKTATVSTRTLFLSSGNNVGPVQDMTRRCITINLNPKCETPAIRTFKRPELVQEIQQQRGIYISAALTIVRAWLAAGSPRQECSSLAGYNKWSDLCCQPLIWLGLEDPAKSAFDAMKDDPDREILGRLLELWQVIFADKATMVRVAVAKAEELFASDAKELKEVLLDIAGERETINRRILGRWIKRNSGRIVNGRRFVRASGSRSAEAWYVELVS